MLCLIICTWDMPSQPCLAFCSVIPPLPVLQHRDGLSVFLIFWWVRALLMKSVLQARGSLEDTKKRIAEAEKRIDEKLPNYVNKKYWWVDVTRSGIFIIVRLCKSLSDKQSKSGRGSWESLTRISRASLQSSYMELSVYFLANKHLLTHGVSCPELHRSIYRKGAPSLLMHSYMFYVHSLYALWTPRLHKRGCAWCLIFICQRQIVIDFFFEFLYSKALRRLRITLVQEH